MEYSYLPTVLYKNRDGTVDHYPLNGGNAWLSLDRAISSCFGSISKRLRTYYKGSPPVYAIIKVIRLHDMKVVWGPKRIHLNIKGE